MMSMSPRRADFEAGSEHLQSFAARNLGLLQAIEKTIAACDNDRELFSLMLKNVLHRTDAIRKADHDKPLDPDGKVDEVLAEAVLSLQRIYEHERKCAQSAIDDKRVQSDDGLVDAYRELVGTIADLHNSIEDLREVIGLAGTLGQPTSGEVFTDVDALMARLTRA